MFGTCNNHLSYLTVAESHVDGLHICDLQVTLNCQKLIANKSGNAIVRYIIYLNPGVSNF